MSPYEHKRGDRVKNRDDSELKRGSGLFLGSEVLNDLHDRRTSGNDDDRKDSDKGDDDSADKRDSDSTDKGDAGDDDSRDSDGKD
jgi:hypothetical protein